MADIEEGKRVPVNHLHRRLFYLAILLEVMGAVVPLGMEIYICLVARRHPDAFRNLWLMVVPWTSLLSVTAVSIHYYEKKLEEKEKGEGDDMVPNLSGNKILILIFALLHLAFGFIVWLSTINGWKFGFAYFGNSYFPMAIVGFLVAGFLLLVSLIDLKESAWP